MIQEKITPIEVVRLSEKAKTFLTMLKRKTGIQNWNVLCRWGFCLSLSEPSRPTKEKFYVDSSIDMSWKVFGGNYADVYFALLIQRCKQDRLKITTKTLNEQFRLHLHRGIGLLANDPKLKNISDLLKLTMIEEIADED
jgi:DNA sulfur modification protein DndE